MDLKKVLDQTVRDLKREVNKKVLKVPEIEQKVLDATSNEPWGPHGTVMADIAQATRNYYECQMIMAIIWKRINDTGRNWRHVYKALTVLEYLVAHGSERVIDEIKEHAYQISTLADFQYVESSGRDQGINVRKKSQTLVALVNDKEKIREVRQKAVDNRDKYRGVSSTGGIYKPSSYHSTGGNYGGDRHEEDSYGSTSRYGSRDDDRYGRDRDGDQFRDEDGYGRDWDRNGRDSDRSGREGDRYKEDNYYRDYHEEDRYSTRRVDDRQNEKYRSFEKDRDRAYDDDDRHSSRSGGGRDDDYGQDDRRADRKPSSARMSAPPSYEEALRSPDYRATEDQRDGGGLAAAAARPSKSNTGQFETVSSMNIPPPANNKVDDYDEFNPRASSGAAAVPLQADDFFGKGEPVGAVRALPPPPGLSSVLSNASDFFGDYSTSGFTPGPPSVNNIPLQQLDDGVFGRDSPFKVEAPAFSNLTAPAAINTPPSFTTLPAGNGAVPAVAMGSNSFDAFAAAPPPPPSQAATVLFSADDFFGRDSFSASGAASNDALPAALPLNIPAPPQQTVPGSLQVNQAPPLPMPTPQLLFPGARHGQKYSLNTYAKPQQEKNFETKSNVWADSLSKGLIDLNIAGPKSNPLADIGIDFDLLRTERLKEERASTKSSTAGMGKAMGSGSGLGMAGASAIAPPAVPVMMGNIGMAPSMGMTPMGMGMGPTMGSGMGMAPPMMQMGLNPGMAMRPGMGMGPAPGMGMGMNSAMGMGMGGFPNQQQQYSGFRQA